MKSLGFINLPLTHQELENASSWESPRLRRGPCRSGTSCRSRRLSLYRRCGWRSRGSGRWPCWWSRTPGSQSPGSWRTRQEAGSCYHSGVLGPTRVPRWSLLPWYTTCTWRDFELCWSTLGHISWAVASIPVTLRLMWSEMCRGVTFTTFHHRRLYLISELII